MEASDDELWSRSVRGDVDAFGRLFDRHARTIYNYCFRRVGSQVIAQDLVSIVFLEAWRRKDKELAPEKVLPWFYGIATNVVRHERRSERRFAAAMRRLGPPGVEGDFAALTDERLDYERDAQRAISLLGTLPSGERDVFVLCEGMGLSYDDAATALGIPLGTVRSRLARARSRVRELNAASGHREMTPKN